MKFNIDIKHILQNKLGHILSYSVLYIDFSKNQQV